MITEKVIQYFHKYAHDHHRHHVSPNVMKKINPIIPIECPLKVVVVVVILFNDIYIYIIVYIFSVHSLHYKYH